MFLPRYFYNALTKQSDDTNNVFNPFQANFPILYPLKTPENIWFSSVFRGYKMGTLAGNGLNEKLG